MPRPLSQNRNPRRGAFTLVEVLMATAVFGIMFTSLYAGISSGFAIIQVARENLRATQVMQEKMETIRLYNWDQINTAGFIPATYTAPFWPNGGTNDTGILYSGTLTITNVPFAEAYSGDMRLVLLTVQWTSGKIQRRRDMRTYISRHGLQNYIY